MSTELKTIQTICGELQVTQFGGRNGNISVQLTQGFGIDADEPKFIQLDIDDVGNLIPILVKWRREQLLSKFHTGLRVRYVPMHADGDVTHQDCEDGTVSSKNDVNVFVKFDNKFMSGNSKSCSPEDLHLI